MKDKKIRVGDKVRTLKNRDYTGSERFPIDTIGIIEYVYSYGCLPIKVHAIDNHEYYYWYNEDELELVEENVKERKFKIGDWVRTLKCESTNGFKRFEVGSICAVHEIDDKNILTRYRIYNGSEHSWYNEDELEFVGHERCQRIIEEIEKLKEELRRKDSELRDLKNLIIKLVYDWYGVGKTK